MVRKFAIRVLPGESPRVCWIVAEAICGEPRLVLSASYALDEPPTLWRNLCDFHLEFQHYEQRLEVPAEVAFPVRIRLSGGNSEAQFWCGG